MLTEPGYIPGMLALAGFAVFSLGTWIGYTTGGMAGLAVAIVSMVAVAVFVKYAIIVSLIVALLREDN